MRLETDRLVIRPWERRHRDSYAPIVADPTVRRFYPSTLDRQQTDEMIDRFEAIYREHGYSFLPVERKSDGALIGHVGIIPVGMPVRGDPPVEIGWILGQQYWGLGYAPEAARAWVDHAFEKLGLAEVVAWTAVPNLPSQRVMQKIGMVSDPADDFLHPKVPDGHRLQPHVLYRITRPS